MRGRFPLVLDLGCHTGEVADAVAATGKTDAIIAADIAFGMASRTNKHSPVVLDYHRLPFARNNFDAIVSGFAWHWVNDLPGLLMALRGLLKADGLLLAALPAGESFADLRACLATAETETAGGLSPRVLPMADMRDLGGLLTRAGFALPVADNETVTITWADPLAMMRDLRGMGETNALADRIRHFTRKDTLCRAAELYRQRFSTHDKARVVAKIDLITLTAWSPASSQQKPLKPGTAAVNLGDALSAD